MPQNIDAAIQTFEIKEKKNLETRKKKFRFHMAT